jgi:predicted DNA-binding transcriptional regulator AlpA
VTTPKEIAMPDRPTDPSPLLIDGDKYAQLMSVSPRTIRRLADAGHGPKPVRVGRCLRWRLDEVADWLAAGCPTGGKR